MATVDPLTTSAWVGLLFAIWIGAFAGAALGLWEIGIADRYGRAALSPLGDQGDLAHAAGAHPVAP